MLGFIQPLFIPPLVIFLILAGVIVAVRRRRKILREEIKQVMQKLNLTEVEQPSKNDRFDWVNSIKKILRKGRRGLLSAWVGEYKGLTVELLQHRYVVSSGNSTHYVYHRIATIPVPLSWPYLQLSRENLITRIATKLGMQDVRVEDEIVNERWRIKADDELFAQLFITPEMQMFLRELQEKQTWIVTNGRFLIMEKGSLRPGDVQHLLQMMSRIAGMIPAELEAWEPGVLNITDDTKYEQGNYQ